MNTSTSNQRHSFVVSLISSWAGLLFKIDQYFHVHSQAPQNAGIYKNTIDCACLQSYIRQILPSSRYYKASSYNFDRTRVNWIISWFKSSLFGYPDNFLGVIELISGMEPQIKRRVSWFLISQTFSPYIGSTSAVIFSPYTGIYICNNINHSKVWYVQLYI